MNFIKNTKPRVLLRRHFLPKNHPGPLRHTVCPRPTSWAERGRATQRKVNLAGMGSAVRGRRTCANFEKHNIVAFCDVDRRYAAGTFKRYPEAKRHSDYRKMLDEQKDIDAVVVATPDHLHAFASMHAIRLGKHVYCEKP